MQQILQGREDTLPPALPYRDFIARICAGRARNCEAQHLAYFRDQLADVSDPTAPFGVLDARGTDDTVSEVRCALEPQLSRRIRQSARQQGVSPAVLFHLAWAQVPAECSGRDDVVFGTVLSVDCKELQGRIRL